MARNARGGCWLSTHWIQKDEQYSHGDVRVSRKKQWDLLRFWVAGSPTAQSWPESLFHILGSVSPRRDISRSLQCFCLVVREASNNLQRGAPESQEEPSYWTQEFFRCPRRKSQSPTRWEENHVGPRQHQCQEMMQRCPGRLGTQGVSREDGSSQRGSQGGGHHAEPPRNRSPACTGETAHQESPAGAMNEGRWAKVCRTPGIH